MKIILLQDVRNIGRKGDVRDVNDGYARNMLFPNKLAENATPSALKKMETAHAVAEKNDQELRAHLLSIAHELSGMGIVFELAANDDGSVFGSIGKDAILKALREHHWVTTERVEVHLERPIKELGEHTVKLDFKKGISAMLKVVVKKKE